MINKIILIKASQEESKSKEESKGKPVVINILPEREIKVSNQSVETKGPLTKKITKIKTKILVPKGGNNFEDIKKQYREEFGMDVNIEEKNNQFFITLKDPNKQKQEQLAMLKTAFLDNSYKLIGNEIVCAKNVMDNDNSEDKEIDFKLQMLGINTLSSYSGKKIFLKMIDFMCTKKQEIENAIKQSSEAADKSIELMNNYILKIKSNIAKTQKSLKQDPLVNELHKYTQQKLQKDILPEDLLQLQLDEECPELNEKLNILQHQLSFAKAIISQYSKPKSILVNFGSLVPLNEQIFEEGELQMNDNSLTFKPKNVKLSSSVFDAATKALKNIINEIPLNKIPQDEILKKFNDLFFNNQRIQATLKMAIFDELNSHTNAANFISKNEHEIDKIKDINQLKYLSLHLSMVQKYLTCEYLNFCSHEYRTKFFEINKTLLEILNLEEQFKLEEQFQEMYNNRNIENVQEIYSNTSIENVQGNHGKLTEIAKEYNQKYKTFIENTKYGNSEKFDVSGIVNQEIQKYNATERTMKLQSDEFKKIKDHIQTSNKNKLPLTFLLDLLFQTSAKYYELCKKFNLLENDPLKITNQEILEYYNNCNEITPLKENFKQKTATSDDIDKYMKLYEKMKKIIDPLMEDYIIKYCQTFQKTNKLTCDFEQNQALLGQNNNLNEKHKLTKKLIDISSEYIQLWNVHDSLSHNKNHIPIVKNQTIEKYNKESTQILKDLEVKLKTQEKELKSLEELQKQKKDIERQMLEILNIPDLNNTQKKILTKLQKQYNILINNKDNQILFKKYKQSLKADPNIETKLKELTQKKQNNNPSDNQSQVSDLDIENCEIYYPPNKESQECSLTKSAIDQLKQNENNQGSKNKKDPDQQSKKSCKTNITNQTNYGEFFSKQKPQNNAEFFEKFEELYDKTKPKEQPKNQSQNDIQFNNTLKQLLDEEQQLLDAKLQLLNQEQQLLNQEQSLLGQNLNGQQQVTLKNLLDVKQKSLNAQRQSLDAQRQSLYEQQKSLNTKKSTIQ